MPTTNPQWLVLAALYQLEPVVSRLFLNSKTKKKVDQLWYCCEQMVTADYGRPHLVVHGPMLTINCPHLDPNRQNKGGTS